MAWNVAILHNSSSIVVVNEILLLSLAALQSLNSHYSSRQTIALLESSYL